MNLVKEKMIKTISEQPEDSTFEEILQELSFTRMIEQGTKESENNKITSTDDLKNEIKLVDINWTVESKKWLREIFYYIAEDSKKKATEVIDEIIEKRIF